MAEVRSMMAGMVSPSKHEVGPLKYELENTCPPALSHKPVMGTPWPHDICGSLSVPQESGLSFLKRRYLETLYLPDVSLSTEHYPL